VRIRRTPKFWSVHTHSRYSVDDALPSVQDIVKRVSELGQRGLGLTDHGNMAGSVELYQECMKAGIKPFPGSEMYFVPDLSAYKKDYRDKHKKAERFHLGVVAYTGEGYENLVNLSTASHQNFFHKPTIDYNILAQLAEDGRLGGLAVTTGCFFGYAAQSLIKRGEGAAKQYLATLEAWFPRSVYVEIQNHGIDHDTEWGDDSLADALVGIADQMGLPVVITQDSHYLVPQDRPAHEALKRLVAFGPDPDDAVFPGDGFHLADDEWISAHHSEYRLARGLEGLGDLLDRHRLHIPVLDSYSYAVPQVVPDPYDAMVKRCWDQMELKVEDIPTKKVARYYQKLEEEFEVIKDSGMAGYMMLVAMITDYMREQNILFQTRGSAAGSLVCWLLGISNVDPIKWDLRFERFLSKDRTKPPDIDLDIAHNRRAELMEWLDTRFTDHQIGTWATYSLDKEESEDGSQKGSLRVKYFSQVNKTLEEGEEKPTWADVPDDHKQMLMDLSSRDLLKGMGTNAAGVVLTSTPEEFNKLVPLHYIASRKGFVTQYGKDQIEALGLVKLDVLGSKTLTVVDQCMMNLGLPNHMLEAIEYRDRPTFQLISSGNTDGVFQMEGHTTSRGCKDLKPKNIHEVIVAMALFRTGVMMSGGTKAYIRRKFKREEVPERHELLQKVMGPTYGVLVYQEQVIDILRALGMDPENLTKYLKAVKASNKEVAAAKEVMKGYNEWIEEKCDDVGMTTEDKEYLHEAIAGFAEYTFNRAHATVYGITAYRCAYLAARHPLEFHAALLSVAAGEDKEPQYLRTTRRRGIRITTPHVNISGATYTVDRDKGVIRKGLRSVDGVGAVSAEVLVANAPYRDLDDLVERSPARPISGGKDYDGTTESLTGVLGKLRDGGALSGL